MKPAANRSHEVHQRTEPLIGVCDVCAVAPRPQGVPEEKLSLKKNVVCAQVLDVNATSFSACL